MGRDRKRGRTAYSIGTLDPPDDDDTSEDVRVWDVTTSEGTGRVAASSREITLYHEALDQSEEPSTSVQSEVGVEEEVGTFADSEAPPNPPKKVGAPEGRKRTRVNKENDSVSEVVHWHISALIRVSRREWSSGSGTALFFWMSSSASMASATRRATPECVRTV